jgi:hypothetical protein
MFDPELLDGFCHLGAEFVCVCNLDPIAVQHGVVCVGAMEEQRTPSPLCDGPFVANDLRSRERYSGAEGSYSWSLLRCPSGDR